MTYNVSSGTLNHTILYTFTSWQQFQAGYVLLLTCLLWFFSCSDKKSVSKEHVTEDTFYCQHLHRSIRTTEDVKIFLVIRRGWQLRINRRSVVEEVRKRETHGDISSEESASLRLLWDLNTYGIHQHCVLAICVTTCINWSIYIYI